MFPEWHHAVPESAYFKVPETLKTFRMYSTSRYAPCAARLYQLPLGELQLVMLGIYTLVEQCILVRHNQSVRVVTFRASGRPRYVTNKQELLVFHAITAFRCESDDSESDLTPVQEEVIVGAR